MPNHKKNDTAFACRVCAETKPEKVVTMNEHNGWFDLYQYCFGIKLSSTDQPLTLCEQCTNKIKDFTSFKAQGVSTDSIWRNANYVSNKDNIQESTVNEKLHDEEIVKEEANEPASLDDSDFYWDDDNSESKCKSETEPKENSEFEDKINLNINDIKPENKAILRSGKIFKIRKDYIKKSRRTICPETNFNKDYSDAFVKPLKKLSNDFKSIQEDGIVLCGICTFSSEDNDVMNKHLERHWMNNDLQCLICEFVGKDQAAIFAHRNIHFKIKTRLQCHFCHSKVNITLRGMEFHYRSVHLHKLGGLCSRPDCNKTFRHWRTWKKHEQAHMHPGYICDLCGQKYKQRKCIIEHLRSHVNIPNPSICHYCGRVFRRQRNMESHIKNVHTTSASVKCSHCNRMYKNQSRLDYHLKQLSKEKKWKCQLCPAAYGRLGQFKQHMKHHSDERPFSCDLCEARFKVKCQLVIHVRRHTGERPYKCVQCNSAFASAHQLTSHNILHTGIKPYKCGNCNKMFREKRMLVKHCALCEIKTK